MADEDSNAAGLKIVRVPRETLLKFVAAMRVGVFVQITDDAGIQWNWPMGTAEGEERVEIAFVDDACEVWLRLSTDREGTAIVAELETHYAGPDAEGAWAKAAHPLFALSQPR